MRNFYYFACLVFALFGSTAVQAQMNFNGETLYGNEWINFDQDYIKIMVDQDGVYKITGTELETAGMPVSTITGADLQLFYMGNEVAIQVSTDGSFTATDFIVFEGKRNDGDLDRQLFLNENLEIAWDSMQLNPKYSLFSDNSAFYLTQSPGTHLRITEEDHSVDGGLDAEAFYLHEETNIYNEFHFKPTYNGADKVRLSDFDICEGFGSTLIKNQNLLIPTSRRYADSGIDPTVEFRYGANSTSHHLTITVGGNVIHEEVFSGYRMQNLELTFPYEDLKNTTLINVKGNQSSSDSYSVAYATLRYPRKIDFPDTLQYSFYSREDAAARYYELDNFTNSQDPLYYYDFENNIYEELPLVNDHWQLMVDDNLSKRKVNLVSANGYLQVKSLSQLDFVDYTQLDPEFVILTSKRLSSEEYDGLNMIDTYADYKSSEKGGGYNVLVIYSEDLIDQFAYGVERNPLSSRNFMNYINPIWTNQQFLFTIGKGVEYSVYRTEEDFNNELIPFSHVPTWGVPGSDNLLYGELGQTAPLLPIGRIAARTAEDIHVYLDKVKSHDAILDGDYAPEEIQWTKKIIHLSGGDAVIQNQIFNWLEEMRKVIEDDNFGADVITFRKSSTDNLQSADSERILNTINNGVAIITFFGHSAVGTFDFSLEAASEYSNKDKYPLLISLGCHSGNIFAGSLEKGLSEEFVFEKDAGALAFLASTSTAYIGPQFVTGRTFYSNISQDFYGQPIGFALKSYYDDNANNRTLSVRSLNQQMTYHGDPSLKFVDFDAPDYLVDRKSVSINPKVVTTSDASYELNFDVLNAGRSVGGDIEIKVIHTIPDGTTAEYFVTIPAPSFKSEVSLSISNPGLDALGENIIDIIVDNTDAIVELPAPEAEENNALSAILGTEGYTYFIESNIAKPVSPSEFSIVTTPKVELIAATTNLFSENTEYVIQIDTSALFEAPLEEEFLTRAGGKIAWSPSLTLENDKVYYWRVSPNFDDEEYIWRESSFVALIDESEGWNQSHFYQLNRNEFDDLELPRHNQMQYDTNGFFISIQNKLFDPNNNACYQFNFEQCASSVSPWNIANDGALAIVVGDQITGTGWVNAGGEYGSINTSNFASHRVFAFNTQTQEDRANVINMLENVIPDSSFVFVFTALKFADNDLRIEEWHADTMELGTSIFKVLEEAGAGLTNELEQNGTVPYNFVYKKGGEVYGENVGTNIYEQVVTTVFIPVYDTEGKIISTNIGPAVSWGHLTWELENQTANDSFSLTIVGIEQLGGKETIIDEIHDQFSYDLSELSANQFEYLRLEFFNRDDVERTAPNLKHWRVYYDEYPEAIFNPEAQYVFNSDTLEQGEFLQLSVNVENITSTPMDELLVHYTITDAENNEDLVVIRDEKINANGSINLNFNYPTAELKGDYLFTVEFNPEFEQKEKFIFNNLGIRNFHVRGSELNPLLDVTFDDRRIKDGDVVSPSPEIVVQLIDGNKFLFNQDPQNFQQVIIREDGSRIEFEYPNERLTFVPGSEENNNIASMTILPEALEAGNYTFVAQAKNAAGNFSGEHEYAVDFTILSNSCVSDFYNYPNPFSDFTHIEYTLTGTVQPESMALEIFDGNGKVIRRIESESLNSTAVGSNRLLFTWDGSSATGAQLANGIYYYRLIINNLSGNKSFQNCGELDSKLHGKLIIIN